MRTELYHGGLLNRCNLHLHLHPLNLCLGEARVAESLGATIFEQSPVVRIEHGASPDIAAELRPRLEATFPQLRGTPLEHAWQGMAGIVINRIPMLGRLSDNVYYAQGYSGHGVATSHIVAEIMAQAIAGHMEEFDTFAACRHVRVPFGDALGSPLLAAGMWYYQMLER